MKYDLTNDPELVITLESLGNESIIVENIKTLFTEKLPNFITSIKSKLNFFDSIKDEEKISKGVLNDKYKIALKHIPALDFLLFADRIISVPEDFEGQLLDYLKILNQTFPMFSNQINDILDEYNLILASFVTNKEDKYSLQDHSRLFDLSRVKRESILSELKVFFPKDTGKTKKRMRDILKNFGELEPLVLTASKLNDQILATNLNQIKNRVNKAIDSLDIILKQMTNNEADRLSQEAALNISKGAFEIGKLIESYVIVYNDARIAVYSVEKLLDTIIDKK